MPLEPTGSMAPGDEQSAPFTDGESYDGRRFSGVGFAGESLAEVSFTDCVFERATLTQATFSRCSFVRCRFLQCDLSVVALPECHFAEVSFKECKAIGVDWTTTAGALGARVPLSLRFEGCVLNLSSFFGLTLTKLSMRHCSLHEVDFREASCKGADFTGSDFSGAVFLNTNLEQADLREARNYFLSPAANRLARAIFALPDAVALLRTMEIRIE